MYNALIANPMIASTNAFAAPLRYKQELERNALARYAPPAENALAINHGTNQEGDPRRGMFPTDAEASSGGDDRELLAKTLMAEAGGEGLEGLLAAGAVIVNRVKAGRYGSGIDGVIMRPGQFSAWNKVTGYADGLGGLDMARIRPSEEAYRAADLILAGQYHDPTGGATHYYNPAAANPKWGQRAGGEWTRIGNHVFGFGDGDPGRR